MDEGTFRVLPGPDDESIRLLDRETYEPVGIADSGHEAPVEDLRPGYLVAADLDWSTADPTIDAVTVERPTLYAFADRVDPMFELAEETWEEALASGDGMNARTTRNTDGAVNGVLYVFAESGDRGRFEEFRDGSRPLEPLVDRVNERETDADDSERDAEDGSAKPDPREVFVLRATGGEFTAVTITLRKGGQFADTIRDTYDLPRPDEPLA